MMRRVKHPLFFIFISYIFGICAGVWGPLPFGGWLFAVGFVSILFIWAPARLRDYLILISFFVLGAVNLINAQTLSQGHIVGIAKYYYRKPAVIRGMIVSDVAEKNFFNRKKSQFTLQVEEVKSPWGWQKKEGLLLVNLYEEANLQYGDLLELQGKLHHPYNFPKDTNFSYKKYLANKKIFYVFSVKARGYQILARNKGNFLRKRAFDLRHQMKRIFEDHLSRNEAGMMTALILGDRSGLPAHIRELFVHTGTAHILAISGLHVGIIAGIFLVLLTLLPFGRRVRLVVCIFLLIFYAALTGFRASVVRAVIMIDVLFLSLILERDPDGMNTLSLAGLLLLFSNPFNVFDIGFQLSFVSVFCILLFFPLAKTAWQSAFPTPKNIFLKYLIESAMVSSVVWLGVLGLIAYHFRIVTPVTIIANIVLIPFLTLVVALGFFMLISAAICPMALSLICLCLRMALTMMAGSVFLFDKIPFAYFPLPQIKFVYVASYYGLCVLLSVILPITMSKEAQSINYPQD